MKITIDPERPNPRLIGQVVDSLRGGGVIAYPTDSVYGLGCDLFQKRGVERVYQIKGKDKRKPLSFICADLKDVARFAVVSDTSYKLMKRLLPGPYTFILTASRLVPRIMTSRQHTVGVRVTDHLVTQAIVERLGNPIVTTSIPPPAGLDYNDPDEIERRWSKVVDIVVDSGLMFPQPSTVLDLTEEVPRLVRAGKGDITSLGELEVVEDLEP